ncbi:hypothetical protein BCV69DRAFT_295237 [Microstroma glucosiphilum]|uniref:Uncharacterized protein n=1 Tax=Pseudomicrostroma glucosiphilum TaxID=1684307 RepID=A0A316TZR6_9BASI|nr:hypothetical protein BCV69DRAFT_295237 [Pseudomicrostroma glucosiphilum]PWN18662.1 hypothetical protein BCV69DRAFT_295237 [Pseudomicrostroma glucosiphilum]
MGAITLTSPAGWKIFRSPADSSSNSTGTALTPPTVETQPPPVSQLVRTGGQESNSSEEVLQSQATPGTTRIEQPKAATSAPATLRPTPKATAARRPMSFIATSKVKTFGKPLALASVQQQPPSTNPPRTVEGSGLLRSLAAKKRLPRWLSRSSDAMQISKPQLVSHSSSHPVSPTPLESILLLGRAETALGVPASLSKEVNAGFSCVTFEQEREGVARKRSASMSTAQLLEEAATKLMGERSAAKMAAGQGKVVPPVNSKDAKAQGKTSVDIITRDAKLQNGLRQVLNQNNKSTPALPSCATGTATTAGNPLPSDIPSHSISRKAVPKLPDCDSDFLPQELPLKSEMLYPGISGSVHLSGDGPTMHSIVVSRAEDDFERFGGNADEVAVQDALKGKVIDLTKEVEAWKKSKLALRASRLKQEQHEKVRRVRVQEVAVVERDAKPEEKMSERTVTAPEKSIAELPRAIPAVHPATPSKNRMSRSSNGSQRSRPPSVPLPSLPNTPRKQQLPSQQRATAQRKVSEAATQTSELAFVVTHREEGSSGKTQREVNVVDAAAPLIDLDSPGAVPGQSANQSSPTKGADLPSGPSASAAEETVTFISQEEASLDFGSLGPPTDSSCLPSSNAAGLNSKSKYGAGANGGGQRDGKLATTQPLVVEDRREVPVPNSSERYRSSNTRPALKDPRDDRALETQFWSLLAQVQAREYGYADALADELNLEPETGASSTSTLSFAGIRDWRERVASEAGRLRKTQHAPVREVFPATARDERQMPHVLRAVSGHSVTPHDGGQWEDMDLPSTIFPPTSTLATRGSASQVTETKAQVQLAQAGNEGIKPEAPIKLVIPPIQVQAHVSTASSSMLSWGTRSRRTLSEHEAQRLFGSLTAVPHPGEEWGVKSGAAGGFEEGLLQPGEDHLGEGERGRKRQSRNTFGVASFDQGQKAGQLAGTNASRGIALAGHNTVTRTTTTTRATQSVVSITQSTSGPIPQAPPAFASLDTGLAQQQTLPASTCESTSTPTAQRLCVDLSSALDVGKDEHLQRALELVAHRIGIASEELERLKRDLHLIARAKGEGAAVTAATDVVAIEA